MKIIPTALIFVLFLVFPAFAQTNQDPTCPTIDVVGSVVAPGEPALFTAVVKGYDLSKLTLRWTVSDGAAFEGQGTNRIKIPSTNLCEKSVTATLEVIGLPKSCPFVESETGSISDCFTRPVWLDEYGKMSFMREKSRLDDAAARLGEYPAASLDFMIYTTIKQKDAEIKARQARIEKYLAETHKIPKERINFVIVERGTIYRTKIWIVPPGAETPTP